MGAKHTPGPWNRDGYGDICNSSGKLIASVDVPFDRETRVADWGTAYANADLIASAPDLLEALRLLIAVFPAKAAGANCIVGAQQRHDAAWSAARAAIAKAEGKHEPA